MNGRFGFGCCFFCTAHANNANGHWLADASVADTAAAAIAGIS
jgi:hypothetical protein